MAIAIERERPERGASAASAAPAGQCCCCCCCCLHTVGSLIGALASPAPKVEEPTVPDARIAGATRAAKASAHGLYWALTAIYVGLLLAALGVDSPDRGEAGILLALFLPGAQLAASVTAAIVVALSRRPGRDLRLRHVGKITVRAFLGGMIGVLVMLVLAGAIR